MPDSAVIVAMRSFKASLLREESTQMREMAQRWLQVERALDGNMAALAERMSNVARDGGTVSVDLLFQESRYRILLSQLTDELGKYTRYADRTITDRQAQLARLGIDHAVSAIEAQGVRAGFARLPVEAVQNMVGLAGDGSPLRSLLTASWPDAAQGMTQALVRGIALGHNPRRVARAMAAGSTRSLDRMMTIARTEQLRSYREASLQSYKASGVVNGYVRIATHDKRCCGACIADEGHFYELNEAMPTHPNCRCAMIPRVNGVPDPQWKKGEEWFNEQDAATQTSILGKGKYEAWQAGRFDLGELVTVKTNATWGDSLQVTTLRDLTGPRVVRQIEAPPYRLAEGTAVRQRIGDMNAQWKSRLEQAAGHIDAIDGEINSITAAFSERTKGYLLPEERESLTMEYLQQTRTLQKERESILSRVEESKSAIRKNVLQELALPQDRQSQITVNSQAWKGKRGVNEIRAIADDAAGFVNQITSGANRPVYLEVDAQGRAYAKGTSIFVSSTDDRKTLVHEMGHVLEHTRGAAGRAERLAFVAKRTAGKGLATTMGGESVAKGDFLDIYAGKIYFMDSDQNPASEIISMGVQWLYDNPERLIEKDPEYFDFIVSYLRGG